MYLATIGKIRKLNEWRTQLLSHINCKRKIQFHAKWCFSNTVSFAEASEIENDTRCACIRIVTQRQEGIFWKDKCRTEIRCTHIEWLTGTIYLVTRDVLWGMVVRSVSLSKELPNDPIPTPNWPIELCALRIVRGVIVDAESDSKLPPSSLSYDQVIH